MQYEVEYEITFGDWYIGVVDAVIEATAELDEDEDLYFTVDYVLMSDSSGKLGPDMLTHDDAFIRSIGHWIKAKAEDDDHVIEAAIIYANDREL